MLLWKGCVPNSACTHLMWFPRTAYRRGVPPFWDKTQNYLKIWSVRLYRDTNAAYPVIRVDVYSVSQERLHNVHITPRAGQCQGALSLPCNCFWVCTLWRKRPIFSQTMSNSCQTVADLFLTLSKRKSTVLFSPNAAAHIRGVKPRSSCLLSSEVSEKIRQKETTIKGGRQSAQDSISEGLASSPLLRCAATSETSPWAANWCTDSADGRVYTILYLWHNVVRYFTIKAYSKGLQSIDAGSRVISFPRCLLVRLVECLDKHSLSLSVFSGDIGSVTGRRKYSVN